MPVRIYNDQEVVAAFNSCIDLDKWVDLPEGVKLRFKELHNHLRVRIVCFFSECGFGLRVWDDKINGEFDNDEVIKTTGNKSDKVDIDGSYLRCPAIIYTTEPVDPKEFIVGDERGRRWLRSETTIATSEESEEEDEPRPEWTTIRNQGKKFTKAEAIRIAERVKGVVLKY